MVILCHENVNIQLDNLILRGNLYIPLNAKAIIIFSKGRGNSRYEKRTQKIAEHLNENNFGTLLVDLLTENEANNYDERSSYINLLASRLIAVTKWLENFHITTNFQIGYFGAGWGAASALLASTVIPEVVAVVSISGRLSPALKKNLVNVNAPTLLIAGSLDEDIVELNKEAYKLLKCEKKMEVIEGASLLFVELGKMEIVLNLTNCWFEKCVKAEKV